MKENEVKLLAIHQLLDEHFTKDQIKVMLVTALEKHTNNNYEKIAELLENFQTMFERIDSEI